MNDYHDRKSNVQASTLKAGDNALIKKTGMGSLTAFDKDPVKIVKTKGSMITAKQGNRQVSRNSSYFKKTIFKQLLQSDPDDQDTVSENGCELVSDSAEGNNATSSMNISTSRKTNNDMPSAGSVPPPIRKSTRVSKRPTRLIETM